MAASYYESSHARTLCSSSKELDARRKALLPKWASGASPDELVFYHSSVAHLVSSVSKMLKLPHPVGSTAIYYVVKTMASSTISTTPNHYSDLVISCVFLAVRTEERCAEFPMDMLVSTFDECVRASRSTFGWLERRDRNRAPEIVVPLVLRALDFCVVVHPPHSDVVNLCEALFSNDSATKERVVTIALKVCNDFYRTSLIATRPTPLLAVTALYVACVRRELDLSLLFDSETLCEVYDITNEFVHEVVADGRLDKHDTCSSLRAKRFPSKTKRSSRPNV